MKYTTEEKKSQGTYKRMVEDDIDEEALKEMEYDKDLQNRSDI